MSEADHVRMLLDACEQPLVGPLTLDTNECKSSLTLYISFENSHDDDDAEPDADDDDDDDDDAE